MISLNPLDWLRTAKRSIEGQWHRITFGGGHKIAGVDVTPQKAMTFSAVYACINCLATDTACLPLDVFRKVEGGGRVEDVNHPVADLVAFEPDGETTSMRQRQALMNHALGFGNGYLEIERLRSDRPGALHLLHPQETYADRTKDGRLWYKISGGKTLPARDVIHIAGLGFDGLTGYTPLRLFRQAIALGLASEAFGTAFYNNASRAGGALRTQGKLSDKAFERLKATWLSGHKGVENFFNVGILEEGLEWVKTTIDPEDAQFLATRQFQVIEIARIYRVPPHKIGDFSQAHLANIEFSNLDYLTTSLMPWLRVIEQEYNRKLFTRDERRTLYVEHNMAAFLRADMKARGEFYTMLRNLGAINSDEIRIKENMNPIGKERGGHKYLVPLAMTTLEAAGMQPEPERNGKRDETT